MEFPSLYINNCWMKGRGPLLTSLNPATDDIIWQGNSADQADITNAVKAARSAFREWAEASIETRISHLYKFKEILELERKSLAEIISKENGKPLWESANEVGAMIGKINISVEAYANRCPEIIKEEKQRKMVTRHHPHGVIAVFGPFNFPAHLPNGHLIPALLAGNTIVFKPSEMTPLTADKMIRLWQKASLPKGVLNLVQGGHETGRLLAEHPDIDGIFFTGSWNTGNYLTQLFSKSYGKILALEMGGNNPLIVSKIKNLEASAYITIQSAYLTSGQRCTCARRLIIPYGQLGDAFLEKLIDMTKTLTLGPYTDDPEPFMGPVISQGAAKNLLQIQDMLKSKGGKCLLEMSLLRENSSFLTPGLIDVTSISERPDEEFFGPLLQVIRVDNFEKGIEEAGKTAYGLTAGLLSDVRKEFEVFSKRLKVGLLCWNTPTTNATSTLPFGGIGKSGNFRPTAYYAADYCAFPQNFIESQSITLPEKLLPGISLANNKES